MAQDEEKESRAVAPNKSSGDRTAEIDPYIEFSQAQVRNFAGHKRQADLRIERCSGVSAP